MSDASGKKGGNFTHSPRGRRQRRGPVAVGLGRDGESGFLKEKGRETRR